MSRNVLITGSSAGIGQKTKNLLLQRGHKVYGLARREQKKDHENFFPIVCDLEKLDPNDLDKIIPSDIDTLFCNAGMGKFANLEQLSYRDIKRMMDINFTSHVYMIKYILPTLKKRNRADIILLCSRAAFKVNKTYSIYSASKFALRGFGLSLREECSSSSVHVSMIHPGMVRTDFFNDAPFEPGDERSQAVEPDDIAQIVDMILNTRDGLVLDEIHLNPLKRIINFKK